MAQGRKADPDFVRAMKGKEPRIPTDERIMFPTVVSLSPPDYLDRKAQHHWERLSLLLSQAGILQEVARDRFARYCQAISDYESVQEERKKLGTKRHTVTMYNQPQMRHYLQVMAASEKTMNDFETEYGMTPASAAKVRRPTPGAGGKLTPEQRFDAFLEELPKA